MNAASDHPAGHELPKLRKISEWFSTAEFVILRAVIFPFVFYMALALFEASINLSIK